MTCVVFIDTRMYITYSINVLSPASLEFTEFKDMWRSPTKADNKDLYL